jgi:predicted Zn finger-like uncharacterized protein
MFRVVPDQLRMSEGWVRCGHCDEVFDANAHLRTLEENTTITSFEAAQSETNVAEPLPVTPDAVQTSPDPVYDWGPLLEPQAAQSDKSAISSRQDALQTAAHEGQEPSWNVPPLEDAQKASEDQHHIAGILVQPPSDLSASEESMDAHYSPTIADDWVYQPLVPRDVDHASASDLKEDAAPSFMLLSPQRTPADRYMGRMVTLSLSFVLALLLTSQFLFLEKDRIAANAPTLRPMLAYGCELLGCTISAPRQIESIAIDSSAFTHVKSGVYNLSLSIRNVAAIDLAAPAIELTLTDMQDQTLVRRVLLPGDYNAKPLIGSRAELVAKIPIAVLASVASEKISGYKLLAFYP